MFERGCTVQKHIRTYGGLYLGNKASRVCYGFKYVAAWECTHLSVLYKNFDELRPQPSALLQQMHWTVVCVPLMAKHVGTGSELS